MPRKLSKSLVLNTHSKLYLKQIKVQVCNLVRKARFDENDYNKIEQSPEEYFRVNFYIYIYILLLTKKQKQKQNKTKQKRN